MFLENFTKKYKYYSRLQQMRIRMQDKKCRDDKGSYKDKSCMSSTDSELCLLYKFQNGSFPHTLMQFKTNYVTMQLL